MGVSCVKSAVGARPGTESKESTDMLNIVREWAVNWKRFQNAGRLLPTTL